jgi:transcriptional regulator with XRE-family HTH domain
MDIGSVIREIRQAKSLTLEEVAYAAGTDGGNLSRIERGLQRCIPELLERIAATLNVPVSELYKRAESDDAPRPQRIREIRDVHAMPPASGVNEFHAALVAKYQKLDGSNQRLVDEFIQMLLRHQRRK